MPKKLRVVERSKDTTKRMHEGYIYAGLSLGVILAGLWRLIPTIYMESKT